ncbi:MAG: HK97-gp10 family putative phage morphogenesis protein [Paracoccaceae bacterium]
MSVRVEGLRELERELDKLTKAAGKGVLRRSLKKAAEPMVDIAMAMVPVDKGDLKASITVSTKLAPRQQGLHRKMFRDDRASIEMFLGPSYTLGAGGRHGHLQEFGTVHHAPQPFMRPAWDQDQQAMLKRLSDQLWVEVRKSVARASRKAEKGMSPWKN